MALSVLTLILVGATSSHAKPPKHDKPPELTLPPVLETAKCKDNSKLYVGCDQIFRNACAKAGGKFVCDVPDCSEGSCFLPEED